MARGRQIYLSYAALVLLGYASGVAADLWTIDIDEGPAPSPEDGPPFSAHATRDPAYLPYQILGIVGSYFIVILFIGTLLLSFGQHARRRAQMLATSDRGTEMVKPLRTYFDPSPVSPQSQRQWYSPGKLKAKKSAAESVQSITSARSPGNESLASFDVDTIEADRQKRAEEMEKLYAAVMAQDEARAHAQNGSYAGGAPPEYTQRAPRLMDAPNLRHLQTNHNGPRSPVKAIYPREDTCEQQSSFASRAHASLSPTYSQSSSHHRDISAGSTGSMMSAASSKKFRRSLKSLKISAPILRGDDDNSDGARTPLSPRVYTNPGIPPEPPVPRIADSHIVHDPAISGTSRSFPPVDDYDYEEEEQTHDLSTGYSQRPVRSKARQNFSQPLRLEVPKQTSTPIASANSALPFRQLHWNSPQSPYYPYQGQGPFSAGPVKTTFVEVRRDRLGPGGPLTGVPTPYSAYMPFTPLTPVTPHLTTRAERKQREKEERTIRGAITEEDQVADDKDLWDSGY